jgi:hypothetical protein
MQFVFMEVMFAFQTANTDAVLVTEEKYLNALK